MLEWYEYFENWHSTVSMTDVRRSLPARIQQELISKPETFLQSVAVEGDKPDVIAQVDELLQTESGKDFQKQRFVEVRKKEIDRFLYYRVLPMRIEPTGIDYELDTPHCDKCLWDLRLHPPITLKKNIRDRCDLGQVVIARSMDIELIVSERIKNLFDGEGVTGLEYEAIHEGAFHLAKISSFAWEGGESMNMGGNFCEEHLVVPVPEVIHRTTPVDEFESDFVMIRGARINGKQYTYVPAGWAVSRKVLELLLKEVRGLQCATIRLNEKFRPCLST